jgi:ubiquinone/menaquinone biosynthesis C-methylase UbiE
MDQGDVSGTYTDVDRSSDPAEAADWMDRVATYAGFRESKARALELLAGCDPMLDVGCGVGDDVRAMGPAAVGVDPSRTMLGRATSRGGRFALAAGERLPFRGRWFGGARADRVLQHVVDPAAVIAELARVTRAGGLVVVTDPDQSTLRIDGPDPELARIVERFRAAGIRHGFLAGLMPEMLETAACAVVSQERFPVVLTDPADAFGIATWARLLEERGAFDHAQARRFEATLGASDADGSFHYSVELVLTCGEVTDRSSRT